MCLFCCHLGNENDVITNCQVTYILYPHYDEKTTYEIIAADKTAFNAYNIVAEEVLGDGFAGESSTVNRIRPSLAGYTG